ncbi:hypothetical protein [Aquirhabdus parva]|uniref:Uncharacterized protein n=1 Tax=Aquirhabdus parva TaxID=2283318 RepID=A0A345P7R2_9GAMM|nr:hypothetical protein [Aquirhabdus parva]AXI03321.1 hypothetical protein HYN46_11000 [Aquirhabdus parva]
MKKLLIATTAVVFALSAGAANACPKGQHMEGGTGAHHKGGKCVANVAPAAKPMAMSMPMAAKS